MNRASTKRRRGRFSASDQAKGIRTEGITKTKFRIRWNMSRLMEWTKAQDEPQTEPSTQGHKILESREDLGEGGEACTYTTLYTVLLTTPNETGRRTWKEHEKGALVSFKHFCREGQIGRDWEWRKAGVLRCTFCKFRPLLQPICFEPVKLQTFNGTKMLEGSGSIP